MHYVNNTELSSHEETRRQFDGGYSGTAPQFDHRLFSFSVLFAQQKQPCNRERDAKDSLPGRRFVKNKIPAIAMIAAPPARMVASLPQRWQAHFSQSQQKKIPRVRTGAIGFPLKGEL